MAELKKVGGIIAIAASLLIVRQGGCQHRPPVEAARQAARQVASDAASVVRSVAPMDAPIVWRTSYGSALAEQEMTQQPIVVSFSAPWCGPCRQVESTVWETPRVRTLLRNAIPLKVNIDTVEGGVRNATRWKVERIPAMAVVSTDRRIVWQGPTPRTIPTMLARLRQFITE